MQSIGKSLINSLRNLSSRQPLARGRLESRTWSSIEPLESRTLMSVSLFAAKADASEVDPTGAGRGVFNFVRTGSKKAPLDVFFSVSPDSTANPTDVSTDHVTIPAGNSNVSLVIDPVQDSFSGSMEILRLKLDASAGYRINARHRAAAITIEQAPDTTPPSSDGSGDSSTGSPAPTTDGSTSGTGTDTGAGNSTSTNPPINAPSADTSRHFRTSLSVDAGSFDRTNKIVDTQINFTQLLASQGQGGALADNSIRVVEIGADGTVLNDAVPFQFDKAADFDASANAAGTLSIQLTGNTPAGATRHYQVYFDNAGAFDPVNVAPEISVDANATDSTGADSIKVSTPEATYLIEKSNGGLSNLIDKNGNDWISFNSTPGSGSAGEFRGIPNIGLPGVFHPGFQTATVTIDSVGPLKTSITATTLDGLTSITYEFFPTYVRATINRASANYWFLYEGTPGGQFNPNDTITLSDGTTNTLANDGPTPASDGQGGAGIAIGSGTDNGEWATFNSASSNRYLFMAHNNQDNIVDSYFDLENNMTVFGFGRSRVPGASGNRLLSGSNTFSFGLADEGGSFAADSTNVNGTYRDLGVSTGATELLSV